MSRSAPSASPLATRTSWRAFPALFLSVFVLAAAWALTTPLGAGPDEPNHMATAYATVHGQVGSSLVTVPQYIAQLSGDGTCFAFIADQPADCQGELSSSLTPVTVESQFGTYLPVYFWIVGLPSLFLSGPAALYAMRLVSAALFAVLVAGALTLGLPRSAYGRPLFAGVLAALTPTAVFLAGVVNSSAFEIGAAVLVWVAAQRAFRARADDDISPRAAMLLTIAASLLLFTRLLAPLWLLIAVGVTVTANSAWRRLFRFLRSRTGIVVLATLVSVGALVAAWDLTHPNTYRGVDGPPDSLREAAEIFVERLVWGAPSFFQSAAGTLGWLDTVLTWAPVVVAASWALLLGAWLGAGAHAGRRSRTTVAALIVTGIVLPCLLETLLWSGAGWQGRYSLPLLVGIPIVATGLLANDTAGATPERFSSTRFATVTAAGMMGLAGVMALVLNYHRYSVGLSATLLTPGVWHAPTGFAFPGIAYVIALAVLLAYAYAPRRGLFVTRVLPPRSR